MKTSHFRERKAEVNSPIPYFKNELDQKYKKIFVGCDSPTHPKIIYSGVAKLIIHCSKKKGPLNLLNPLDTLRLTQNELLRLLQRSS